MRSFQDATLARFHAIAISVLASTHHVSAIRPSIVLPTSQRMYAIQDTQSKGLDVFATEKMSWGTRIMSEMPLMSATQSYPADPSEIYEKFNALSPE